MFVFFLLRCFYGSLRLGVFLVWFCISQSLLRFSSTLVDLGSILPGFHFLFFLFFVFLYCGGSGVLSHGAGFLFILTNTVAELDIGTLCCTWLGDGAT